LTLRQGKLDSRTMQTVVYRSLGSTSRKVVAGPARGMDNAVISIGGGRRMLMTTDPVSIIPAVGMKRSAWMSVHLIASDYTTSGLRPEFATFTYNLPQQMRSSDVEEYLRAVGRECDNLGVSVVAGHTGSYPGGGFTVVGGGTMFGFCRQGEYVDPTMARQGDAILMTKGAAIEATAMLACSFPRQVERLVGRDTCKRAEFMLSECSTVKDALAASAVGLGSEGVTSMHDATEGGILGGLAELADASGMAFCIDEDEIHVSAEASAVCSAFNIDPLTSVSEGSLLLTCNPARAEEVRTRLRKRGVPSFQIGRVSKGRGVWALRRGSRASRLKDSRDGYWSAYERAVRSRLN